MRLPLRLAVPLLFSGNAEAAFINNMLGYSPTTFIDTSASDTWQDSAATTPATANADVIGRIDDMSGNGNHFTQTTTADKPTLRLSVLNGLPVTRFDGTDFLTSSLTMPEIFTAMAVITNRTGTNGTIFSSNGANAMLQRDSTNDSRHWKNAAGSSITVTNGEINETTIITWSFDYTNDTYFVRVGNNTASDAIAETNPAGIVILGARGGTLEFLNGDIAAFVLFSSILSETDRDAVELLLTTRYGITI